MKDSEFIHAIKKSIINGKWGRGYTKMNGKPHCLLGHAESIHKFGTRELYRIFPDGVIAWNDYVARDTWHVVATLGKLERSLKEKGL